MVGAKQASCRSKCSLAAAVLGLAGVLSMAALALAAAVDLDPSFSGNGKVLTKFHGGSRAYGLAIDPDRRLVTAGTNVDAFALARYRPNGHLDRSFSSNGKLRTRFRQGGHFWSFCVARSVATDSKGRVVVAGYVTDVSKTRFALARYTRRGRLDRSFSRNGRVTTGFGGEHALANAIAIDHEGRIVAAGFDDDGVALARYRASGRLDRSFGVRGKVTMGFDQAYGEFSSVVIDLDDRIVAAGDVRRKLFAVARYKRNGDLDPSFGEGGTVTTNIGFDDVAQSAAIDHKNRIVVAGESDRPRRSHRFALVRYRPDGTLDGSFGTGGIVTTDFVPGHSIASSVAIDSRGRIVAAGHTGGKGESRFAIARYQRDGILDPSFSGDGKLTTSFRSQRQQRAESVAIDARNRIAAAGFAAGKFALARYIGYPRR